MQALNNYEINGLCRTFYTYMMEKKFDTLRSEILLKYSIDFLLNTKNKGLISLILQYGISTNNKEIIDKIFPYVSMKRDYLNYIVYNKENKELCLKVFQEKIMVDTILSKDIEFLIENNLYFLIKLLDGKFIKIDYEGSISTDFTPKKYFFENSIKYFSEIIKDQEKNIIDKFMAVIEEGKYKYIIDAGNILYSRNGQICDYSVIDLQFVINKFPNSLIIIHRKHLNNHKIKNLVKDKLFFSTPYLINDDIFILAAYLFNNQNLFNNSCKIISNDCFKDHTIKYEDWRNHLLDDIIKYENKNGHIIFEDEINYSNCIQVFNDEIYIPGPKGFIRIWF